MRDRLLSISGSASMRRQTPAQPRRADEATLISSSRVSLRLELSEPLAPGCHSCTNSSY